jgi:DNA polymerase-3 subunit delta
MAEITYPQLKAHLKGAGPPGEGVPPPVTLIFGEELFVRHAFDAILAHLLPSMQESINFEPLDGATVNLADVVARLNTYALLAGTKVVAVKDARVFHGKEDAPKLLESARGAHAQGDLPKAARALLGALAQLGLALADFQRPVRGAQLPAGWDPGAEDGWIDELLAHCTENQMAVPAAADPARLLEEALLRGFPPGNHLVLTVDSADRRRTLFKAIDRQGLIIDCSVPKGERKADHEAQEAALSQQLKAVLDPCGKTMGRPAFEALREKTGFDPGVFTNNLRLLIEYTGARREITAADVEAALPRTKKDPIFELTNAVADRQAEACLRLLGSMLSGEIHPLQALAAVANQVRRLLLAKDFTASTAGAAWRTGCPFPQFQKSVLPALVESDRQLLERLTAWEQAHSGEEGGGAKKKKTKIASDLVLAKNPGNAYPIYQLLKKSDGFTRAELLEAFPRLAEADVQLKSSPLNPRLILERLIWQICGGPAP